MTVCVRRPYRENLQVTKPRLARLLGVLHDGEGLLKPLNGVVEFAFVFIYLCTFQCALPDLEQFGGE